MRTYIELSHQQDEALPARFHDVRYPPALVRTFLAEFTQPGDTVFDPFAGYGTTLRVAEAMGRLGIGLEYTEERYAYARAHLQHPEGLRRGDARQLASFQLPPIDCCMTSPPYMHRNDARDPFAAFTTPGRGYAAYLQDMRDIYQQICALMRPNAVAIIGVANLRDATGITPLA